MCKDGNVCRLLADAAASVFTKQIQLICQQTNTWLLWTVLCAICILLPFYYKTKTWLSLGWGQDMMCVLETGKSSLSKHYFFISAEPLCVITLFLHKTLSWSWLTQMDSSKDSTLLTCTTAKIEVSSELTPRQTLSVCCALNLGIYAA